MQILCYLHLLTFQIVACPKHYAVHSGRDNDRAHFTANATMHDLYDTYLPAFKSQIMGGKAGQVMPAYSGTRCKMIPNGAPDCANDFLLKTVLREEFGGYNVSVCSDNGKRARSQISSMICINM